MQLNQHAELLEQLDFPAFIVKEGCIHFTNSCAISCRILAGQSLDEILDGDADEYKKMTVGRLCLQLNVQGKQYEASVIRTEECDIFYLEFTPDDPELHSLAVASQSLRGTLAETMLHMESLDKSAKKALLHSIYKLHRAIANMSDTAYFDKVRPNLVVSCHIPDFFAEIMEKSSAYLARAGITLQYQGSKAAIFAPVDKEKLERGVLNMISNAAKFNDGNAPIRAELHCTTERFLFCVYNHCATSATQIYGNLFASYRRDTSVPDARKGIGLGMTIARRAACVHGGTLMFDQPEPGIVRLTMAIPLRSSGSLPLRSPVVYPLDYAGGYDHVLLELADVLPDDVYA